ncbi:hypothetical protein OUZ56_010542 [Daphnia magna]|uniref:Uncharacterized protein n=1 Tax=Daphnia magna TaxID=35525 RepID=A0ABR0AIU8_9CRUS|nr:hypothetical protein OUZ56_010542 [Daphnia magna]
MNWSSNNIVKTLAALKTSQHRLQQPRPPSIPSLSDGPYTATIPQPNVLSITATLKKGDLFSLLGSMVTAVTLSSNGMNHIEQAYTPMKPTLQLL